MARKKATSEELDDCATANGYQRMLSRRDFLSSTKPLYGSGFLRKKVEAPDIATVKDFLRFYAAKGKGKIVKQITCDSLNSVAEWLSGGFTRVTDTETNKCDRTKVYNVSIVHHL
jgi:hypothetical protein